MYLGLSLVVMWMGTCLCVLEVHIFCTVSVGWWGVGLRGIRFDIFAFVLSERLLDGDILELRFALGLL